ncbi:UDP-N-acetylglucosamine 1-carboxyvinyltransferase [Geminisphaera colitermitum]|uniref:UDP-N-acetylglucosamine 1-carboxyvinyltransferase n=1 Tax=Geminisphaera colitermitum TaxID=1148786 RepID=UPI000158CB25|nr:UDP-N-acetylglucosamine 1-carboxyvinyltransferase [Geminisphaera colitermitum]
MADLIVNGGRPLSGTVTPSGNKNSILPVFCATLLTDEPVTIKNVPDITDLNKLAAFFESQGSRIDWDRARGEMRIDHSGFRSTLANDELPQDMRSTVLLYPALLHRLRKITIQSNTKGCSLGVREIDPHLEILSALGAVVNSPPPPPPRGDSGSDALVIALPHGFQGARHWCDYMSVTVTENFAMAAALADGESTLINAASEPHVQDLCAALVAMGARIEGLGTSRLRITGVQKLHGATLTISSDYHEIVTFLALGAITGGEVRVTHALPQHFDLITRAFQKLGVCIEHETTNCPPSPPAAASVAIVRRNQRLIIETPYTTNLLPKIEAAPWPYFSVDLLPLMIALSTRAEGVIHFWNKVYENGFSWIPELAKFGAHALVSDPHRIVVFGNKPLRPAVVDSPYIIRAAVALTMVAASIPGRSVVRNAEIIKRAHPRFVENLRSLGADLEWKTN